MSKRFFYFLVALILMTTEALAHDVVVKSTTNRDDFNIGDYWIAEDFADGFEKNGLSVDIDYRGEYHREHKPEPKINLYMRGYTKFNPPFGEGVNVLYCYYPMAYDENSKNTLSHQQINKRAEMPEDASLDDDWQNYDLIAVASPSYTDKLKQAGIKALYVPQFTNPEKFYPAPEEELKTDILFVGSNWHDRTSLRYAIESGFEVAVYGYNWGGIVPDEMYKAPYIANKDLNRYYSSAKIVLNDHRPDMKAFGFVNNRIYDASAAGALVISDYMPEIEIMYGDSIPMYKTKEELAEKLAYFLSHEKERQQKAEQARHITLRYFTNTAAAKLISEAAKNAEIH